MQSAPLTSDEDIRLALLDTLEILDTEPEEVFDRVTRMASRLLGMPITAVSLIDADRQWFKASVGLAATETPRDWAFCAHAIHGQREFVVQDAALDPRFSDNPLVAGNPNIRFYAGVPVTSLEGVNLGTLCVVDTVPRTLAPEDVAILRDLARTVSREFHVREAVKMAKQSSRHARRAIARSEARFRGLFEQAAVGMALLALDGTWLQVNETLADILGRSPSELIQTRCLDITASEDLGSGREMMRRMMNGDQKRCTKEKRYVKPDGTQVWVSLTLSIETDEDGEPLHFIAVIEDISERKVAQAHLHALQRTLEQRVEERTEAIRVMAAKKHDREQQMRSILQHANDAFICIDDDGVIREWNRKAEELFGWTTEEAVGMRIEETIIPPEFRAAHGMGLSRSALGASESMTVNRRVELPAMTRTGERLPVEISLGAVPHGDEMLYCAFIHDISARRTLLESLEQQARQDPLTGLPNRRELMAELPKAMARADRSKQPFAVLFLDLNGFKAVNDTLGHEMADRVLCGFATQLLAGVRETDMVARLAGDEFVVMFEGLKAPVVDAEIMSILVDRINEPLVLDNKVVPITASIGMHIYEPGSEITPEQLLCRADEAMYAEKRAQRSAAQVAA